jgi:hypothetical protein
MEIDSQTRKYTSSFRRKINLKISKLNSKKDLVNIYNIVKEEQEVSINRNGMFFNINLLTDNAIDKIDSYLNENTDNITVTDTESKIKYKPYSIDEIDSSPKLGPKLSNQEKSILKKIQKN